VRDPQERQEQLVRQGQLVAAPPLLVGKAELVEIPALHRVHLQDRSILSLNEEVQVLQFLLLRLDRRGQLRSKRLSPGHL
jgi:hypothetical protein